MLISRRLKQHANSNPKVYYFGVKKTAALFLAAICFSGSISTPANGAVMPGGKCAVKGQIKNSQGKKFTCVKSGKKLIWNRGTAISKPFSEASPSILPKEEIQVIDSKWYSWNFRFNKAGVLERRQSGTSIWSSAPERSGQVISPVRSKAFDEIKKFQTMNSISTSEYNLYFSPNVAESVVQAFKKYFSESMTFFTKRLPSGATLDVLIATEKDIEYRRSTLTEILGSSSEAESFIQKDTQLFKQFDIPDPRNTSGGGGVTGTNNSKRFLYTGAVCSCFTDENLLMYNVAHEVTHFYQLASTPSVKKQNFTGSYPNFVEGKIYMPSTLIEGSDNTLGSALTVEHVGWYSDQMDWHLGRYKKEGLLKSITIEAEEVNLM